MRHVVPALAAVTLIATLIVTFQKAAAFPLQAPPETQTTPAAAPAVDLGQQLLAGLRATPGCLGVETATTDSGKHVIFAWFENKRAVLAWLESDAHKAGKRMFSFITPPDGYRPLAGVPDDAGPLMAVAAATFPHSQQGDAPANASAPPPQFSIEVYTPLTPGLRTTPNAGFAPAVVERLFTARRAAAATP
jgi:hypothetical protein